MPYIPEEQRPVIDRRLRFMLDWIPVSASKGAMNYIITKIIRAYIGNQMNYDKACDAVGTLECVKLELYRSVIGPYERLKQAENGDVFI